MNLSSQTIVSWLERLSRFGLYALAFLLPLWFLPFGGMELSRATVFGGLIFIITGMQLVKILMTGSISYIKSPVNIAVLALVAVAALSTFFSGAPYAAFGHSDIISERFLSLVGYALLYALVISVLKGKNEPIVFTLSLIAGGTVAGLIALARYFGVYLPFDFAQRIDFNAVGTINGFALYAGALLALVVGALLGIYKKGMPTALHGALWFAFAVLFMNLIIINFVNAWILFLVGMVLLAWLYMRSLEEGGGSTPFTASGGEEIEETRMVASHIRGGYFYFLLALLVIPILFIFIRVPLFSGISLPFEVSPSIAATWNIGVSVVKQGALQAAFGLGPGTFGHAYGAFHDKIINLTNFWGVRFEQGYSFVFTVLSTMGIVGIAAVLGVIGSAVWSLGGILARRYIRHPFLPGIVSSAAFLLLSWFLYPANFVLLLAGFALLGLSVAVISGDERGRFSGITNIRFSSPWAVFLSSLSIVFFLGLALAGLFYTIERYRASLYLEQAINAIQREGDIDKGVMLLERAAAVDSFNDRYQRFAAQGRFLKIQNVINEALGDSPPPTVQADFQREVSAAIAALQRATQVNPLESFNFRTAGSIYEALIPFIPGADQSAINAYSRAAQLDPVNPLVFAEIARTYLVVADVAQNLAGQTQTPADQKKTYSETRANALNRASQFLNRSIELKADFATGHFLLAQVSLRQGKTDEAIQNTENARAAAPGDIGILFQLGLLYYQNGKFTRAEEAFSQALVLNENYSNARYFLGLILARKGQTAEAIKHFERILALNPGNAEIEKILGNLRAGKEALAGIAPPPPEERSETPVKETAGKEKTPIRK